MEVDDAIAVSGCGVWCARKETGSGETSSKLRKPGIVEERIHAVEAVVVENVQHFH